jgi:hypothetical protein
VPKELRDNPDNPPILPRDKWDSWMPFASVNYRSGNA